MTPRVAPAVAALLALPDETRHLGVYHLARPLGRGGFAPVWLAREVYGGAELRTVAIKLFAVEEDAPRSSVSGSRSTQSRQKREQIVAEARALCQVEHPNIVRFFAIATDGAGAVLGLAMEYVHGTPLDKRLEEKKKLSVAEVLEVGRSVASALAAVHQVGLVHRDIKPANVIDSAGVYKLIDFGIASLGERPGDPKKKPGEPAIILDDLPLMSEPSRRSSDAYGIPSGTLGYIDPACVERFMEATASSDLYSLGVMLFECVTGELPSLTAARREGTTGLSPSVLGGQARAPALTDVAPDVPASLARLVDALLDPEPDLRPRSAEAVAWELERIRREVAGRARPIPPEERGPFRGLGRFEEDDRDVYFGRSVETAGGLEMIRTRGLVALVGPSGSGKSSLARAGLVPAILDGELGGWPKRWDSAVVIPGADPRAALCAALESFVPEAAKCTPEELAKRLADRAERDGRGLVVLVDQLEELVTLAPPASRAFAVQFLARIGAQVIPGIRCLVTARRDLLDELLALPELGRTLTRGTLLVSPLTDEAWEDVVDHALDAYGYRLEDDAMRASLLAQLKGTSSAMPLVQFAMTELWARRDKEKRVLPRASLDAIGGVAGALEIHADATLAGIARLGDGATAITRNVLVALTTPKGSRAKKSLPELLQRVPGSLTERVVTELTDARLIVQEADGLTLAHEALLTRWGALKQWIEEARERRVRAEELDREAAVWNEERRPADRLLRGRRLRAALGVMAKTSEPLGPDTVAFLDEARARRRRERMIATLPVLLVLVLGVVLLARWNAHRVKWKHCGAYVARWHAMECVGALSTADRRHRPASYRFKVQQGRVLRVDRVNADDDLKNDEDGVATWEHAYGEDGKLEEVVLRDRRGEVQLRKRYTDEQRRLERLDAYGYPKPLRASKATHARYELDPQGFVKSERFFNYADVPALDGVRGAYGYAVTTNDRGLPIAYDVLGPDGLPSSTAAGISHTTRVYDDAGNVVEEALKDAKNRPVLGALGYASVKRVFDRWGNLLEQSFRDEGDRYAIGRAGYATERSSRDDHGNLVKVLYFDPLGALMSQNKSYAGWLATFDEHGNETVRTFLGTDEKPVTAVEGFARWTAVYDARGNRIEQSFHDESGKPTLHPDGYATRRWTFDAHDDETAVLLLDMNGEPVIGTEGYARATSKYDEHHNVVETAYEGVDSRPIQAARLNHARRVSLHKDGREIEHAFFGASGAPTLTSGYARASFAYDKNGNLVEARYFGTNGRPVLVSGAARRVYAFDERGNKTEESLYGVDSTLVSDRYSRSRSVSTFDEYGRQVAEEYFDANKSRTLDYYGVAGWRTKLDPQGRELERVSIGVSGQPVVSREDGYARATMTHDDHGRVVERRYFGADDAPVLAPGGAARLTYEYDVAGNEVARMTFDVAGTRTKVERTRYDARNRRTELAHFDGAEKPAAGRYGTSRAVSAYDERGHRVEQSFYDDAGNLTIDLQERAAKWTARFDARGKELERAYFGVDGMPILHDGAARIENRFDASGNLVERAHYGVDGKLRMRGDGYAIVATKYNQYRQPTETAFFDTGRKRALEVTSRAAGWASAFDMAGREIERSFFGTASQPIVAADGYYKRKSEYDERGKEVARSYFDVADRPMLVQGAARWTKTLDERGEQLSVSYFGIDGRPTNNALGVSYEAKSATVEESFYNKDGALVVKNGYGRKVSKLDGRSKPIETSYYGADGRAIIYDGRDDGEDLEGWRIVRAYDSNLQEIERVYFGFDGKRRPDKYGVAVRRFRRNEHGDRLEEAFFDAEERPVEHRELGYSRETNQYIGRRRVEQAFFGTNDQPVVPLGASHRFARATWAFDDRGNEIARRYFGPDGAPIVGPEGYASAETRFDKAGNRVEVSYFGVDRKPIRNSDGVAGWRSSFNSSRQETERTYFDVDGKPFVTNKGYATAKMTYDRNGYELERTFVDASGAKVADVHGCAAVRTTHKEDRGGEATIACVDLEGRVVPKKP